MRAFSPEGIHPPFAAYSHGVVSPDGLLAISGQLGISADGTIPDGAVAQADICFANIEAVLQAAGLDRSALLRINAYVTDRVHLPGYMAARDGFMAGITPPRASTLMIVSGFARPEFVVEVEALAVRST
ncbi:MAG: RidA family protein [Pseudomonadota bacterium]